MVKLGVLNSRMKDFYDIWLLSRQFDFDGAKLAMAIQLTFEQRGTKLPLEIMYCPIMRRISAQIQGADEGAYH